MSRIDDAVEKAIRDPQFGYWKTAWRSTITEWLAKEVANRIDVSDCTLSDDWGKLDDPVFLSTLVPNSDAVREQCANRLLEINRRPPTNTPTSIVLPSALDTINSFILNGGDMRQGRGNLRRRISSVAKTLIPDLISTSEFRSLLSPEFWTAVGHKLASAAFHANQTGRQPEWLLLNQLLLAEWMFGCQFCRASHVAKAMGTMRKSIQGIRGQLFRIPTHISAAGICDKPPTLAAAVPIRLKTATVSDLSKSVESVAADVRSGSGPFFTFFRQVDSSQKMQHCTGLYEYTTLSYLTLSTIEQLIRSYAESAGITHLKTGGVPEGINKVLKDGSCTAFSPSTIASVNDLFSTDGPNIRNRFMHGAMLDCEGKWDETAAAVTGHYSRTVWKKDPFRPRNIFHICANVLKQVDADLESSGAISSLSFAWTTDLRPSRSDMEFAARLGSDLLRESDAGQLRADGNWTDRIDQFAKAFMPCFQHFAIAAVMGWNEDKTESGFARFCGFTLTFEAAYRLVVHLLGFEVLQVSHRKGTAASGAIERIKFQTSMLDSAGICRPEILQTIVDHLPIAERANAVRSLEISIRARNAFAHGAFASLTDQDRKSLGNVLFKAIQTLITCSETHMVKEAAYLQSLNGDPSLSPDDHWLLAKSEIKQLILQFNQ